MTAPLPLIYEGDGGFVTPRGWKSRADAAYVIGQVYLVQPVEQRSAKQHARYFALVNEYWATLPEDMTGEFKSSDHLRKHALCRTGYCDVHKAVYASAAEARKASLLMKRLDSFCVVDVDGRVVTVMTAHSQNTRAMDKKTFQASADAVLSWIETTCLGLHREAA